MKHRSHPLLLICICVLFLGGCDFKDIDKRLFVLSIGIDKAEHLERGYKVSLKLGLPKGQSTTNSENFQLLTEEQETIYEAVQLISSKVDKQLDFGQAKGLILGKSLVNEDYRDALDWLNRQRFMQGVAWIGVGKPSALAVLKVRPKSEELPSNALFQAFGHTGAESQYIHSQYLFEFYRNTKEKGVSPVLPYIEAKNDHYEIDQACVLDDKELILTLSSDHTKLLNLLTGKVDQIDFKTRLQKQPIVAHIDQIGVKHSLHLSATKPLVMVHLQLSGLILERTSKVKLTDATFRQTEQLVAAQVETEVTALLEEFQEYKLDPAGFGLTYRSTHWEDPAVEWQNWQRIYPKLKFQVQADVELRASGATQ